MSQQFSVECDIIIGKHLLDLSLKRSLIIITTHLYCYTIYTHSVYIV